MNSPDSRWIATGSEDGTIILWDANGQLRQEWAVDSNGIYSLEFSPDGRYLASASRGDEIEIWDLGQEAYLATTLESPTRIYTSCAWSPDGTILATSASDGSFCFWDMETFKELYHKEG